MKKTTKILMVLGVILISTTLASAALLQYFGKVTTTVTAQQSVKIDGNNWDTTITHDIQGIGGCCYCFPHTVTNNGCEDIELMWQTGSVPEGIYFDIYEKCYLQTLELNILDGIADDSFDVYVDDVLVYSYTNGEPIPDPECWHLYTIDLTEFKFYCDKTHTVKIEATGDAWQYFGTYGQLAVDYISLTNALGTTQTVDIGDVCSEATHNLQGWGPIEPATHGGGWGGIDDCRVIWFDQEPSWATVDFTFDCCDCVCEDGTCDGCYGIPVESFFDIYSGQTLEFCFVYKLDMLLMPGVYTINTKLVPTTV